MRRWLRFRKSIALRTKVYFNSYLTRKNYSGQLLFFHKDHRLEIEVGVVWCGVVWCDVVWCGVVWCGVHN